MSTEQIDELIKTGDKLFEDRANLLNLWQQIGENFYPQRADFTTTRIVGTDWAANLTTSYPLLCHRDLAAAISNTRPVGTEWFKVGVKGEELKDDGEVQGFCGYATGVMQRAMYDRAAKFTRATKEGDKDFSAFGQCAITVEMNYRTTALLYRSWHLRDVVWTEGPEGDIDTVHRRWKPTVKNLVKEFGRAKVHPSTFEKLRDKPNDEIEVRHVVLPSEDWQWATKRKNAKRFPYVCLYIDVKNCHVIEETPLTTFSWVIPRWETISGSQYAFSPAAMASLPDARLLQDMVLTILESGQKAVDPPIVAKQELFRSDVNMFAGGFTWADIEGDDDLRKLIMPFQSELGGLKTGMELANEIREMLSNAWYLNKIFLPPFDPGEKMTAFEVSKRTEEAYRASVTLFEPIEAEYNARICETTFELLMAHGAFGLPKDMPDALSKQDVEFTFESPLRQAKGRADIARFHEGVQITAEAATLDPSLADNFNGEAAYRDAMRGVGGPPEWIRDPKEVEAIRADRARAAQIRQAAEQINAGAVVADNVGQAAQSLRAGFAPEQAAA